MFITAKCINFTTSTRFLQLCQVFVLLCLLKTKKLLSINNIFSLLSARSDISFIEGFNLAEIIEMIDYMSTSKTLHYV